MSGRKSYFTRSQTAESEDIDHIISAISDAVAQQEVLSSDDESETTPLAKQERVVVPPEMLQTDPSQGLSSEEARSRLRQFGANELSENVENLVKKFFSYFVGPIQFVMELAVLLAAGLQLWVDFGVICAMLLLNAVVGFLQEYQAGNIVSQLKTSMALKATVVRDGRVVELDAIDIVPGDIVKLEEGSIIPADGHLIDENAFLQVDQSTLTGESLAVEKLYHSEVFSSSAIKRGSAVMMVTSIGDHTFLGRTASLVNKTERSGHFAAVLSKIGTILLILVIVFVLIVWISGFFRSSDIVAMLTYTLIITVVGVPVGLPAVVTTTMAVGAADLARKKAVVRKLAAIESLAGVDILCSDKTGTLTQNRLTLHDPYLADGADMDLLLATSALACSRVPRGMDAIDKAILLSLRDHPLAKDTINRLKTISFQPFDPVSKRASAVVQDEEGHQSTCLKGAPASVMQYVLGTRSLDEEFVQRYKEKVEEFASRGFRSLGIARKEGREGEWNIIGILSLHDPPRTDAASTILEAKQLGLSIKMLTGDAVGIAKETASQLGLGVKIYDTKLLTSLEDKRQPMGSGAPVGSRSQVNRFIEDADGFAEVFPQHKFLVVEELQKAGHLVAMTGDGVNDAPSLKRADTGIAVEGASSAARAAADIVFLRAGLSAIIDALKTARMIFQRMRSYVIYRIALSLHLEIYFTTTIVILNMTLNVELVAFLAIFSDIATLAIAYDNATYSRQPTDWNLSQIWIFSSVLGFILAGATWIIKGVTLITGSGIVQNFGSSQGIIFLEIALTQSWLIFITRYSIPFNQVTRPSIQLVGAILAVDIIATCFCLFGWFTNMDTDIVTVICIWIYSFGITAILFLVFYLLSHSKIGRKRAASPALHDTVAKVERPTV